MIGSYAGRKLGGRFFPADAVHAIPVELFWDDLVSGP
jgi:hypothetical protein